MRPLLPWLSVVGLATAGAWAHERPEEPAQVVAPLAALGAAPVEEPSLTLRGCSQAEEVMADAEEAELPVAEADAEVEIEELEFMEVEPPDPLETGTSTLVIQVTDDTGAKPERLDLELWRLGAPANEHWLAGDCRQARASVEQGRVEWTGLPEGRYRLFSDDLRRGAEDPEAFEVAGGFTFVSVVATLPRQVPVLVQVLDETGAPLCSAQRRTLGVYSGSSSMAPPWKVARRLRRGFLGGATWQSCCGCGFGREAPTPLEATEGSFPLGPCTEASRSGSRSWTGELLFEGRTSVTAYVDGDDVEVPHPLRYVGVSVPLERLTAHVWTADGRLALDEGARFEARCRAERVPEGQLTPAMDHMPIEVEVTLEGYEPLSFVLGPRERPKERTLRRAVEPELPAR